MKISTRLKTGFSAVVAAGLAAASCAPALARQPAFSSQRTDATADGQTVVQYTLRNSHGIEVRFLSLGGIITAIMTPDKNGNFANIVCGFPSTGEYLTTGVENRLHFGALIGRYANRIAKGKFTLDGQTWQIPVNDPPNAIHGGPVGFDRHNWQVSRVSAPDGAVAARLTLVSPDGDQGFPGELTVSVTYTLNDKDQLLLHYTASTTKPTVVNLTNHTYFNLSGQPGHSIEQELLTIWGERWTPTDSTGIPTGTIEPVAGTSLDFQEETQLDTRLNAPSPLLTASRGLDANWIINGPYGIAARPAARLLDPATGRMVSILSTQPGLQVFTGRGFGNGTVLPLSTQLRLPTDAIAFEPEHFPDSPNHPQFPSTTLLPGQWLNETTAYQFTTLTGREGLSSPPAQAPAQ
ncbi:galactose mutarotase [Acetobacter sp. AN02]|uniref:aldose epimerase family protein n=1 Tax=Acetobacter sp. AN02 TaxID=2894186 RepID=UPI0024341C8A|nr:galactose mutarotase [Acetobacter sp. AN02]MDG6094193.1 galactose mutarotase [Acetobacter sp. AN02]